MATDPRQPAGPPPSVDARLSARFQGEAEYRRFKVALLEEFEKLEHGGKVDLHFDLGKGGIVRGMKLAVPRAI